MREAAGFVLDEKAGCQDRSKTKRLGSSALLVCAYNSQQAPARYPIRFQVMIAAVMSISPTHEAGIVSHLLTAVACGIAWTKSRGKNRLTATLGLLELFLLFDAVLNWRWILHGFLVKTARELMVYEQRTLPQEVSTALLACATLVAAAIAIRQFWNRPGACLAICGGLISAGFWAIEVISLHAIDSILERMVGPMAIIASVWIVSSALIIFGVLWDAKAFSSAQISTF